MKLDNPTTGKWFNTAAVVIPQAMAYATIADLPVGRWGCPI